MEVSLHLFSVMWIFPTSLGVICYHKRVLSEGHKNYFKHWCLTFFLFSFFFYSSMYTTINNNIYNHKVIFIYILPGKTKNGLKIWSKLK